MDHERLIQYLLTLSPLPDDQERRLIRKFEEIAGAVLIGNGVCGLIQGVLGGLLFALFDLGAPVLWGGIMAVLAFLPIFGIGLVLIPTGLIHILTGSPGLGVFVLLFYLALSFSMEYLFKPEFVGRQVKMHTLLVFLSIMGGLSSFGFMGIIYGPLIITAFLTMADIYMTSYDKYIKAGYDK
jgi:predicted PurR-regulated permease PerM